VKSLRLELALQILILSVPTVFVFTKYDKLIDEIEIRWDDEGREYTESEVEVEAERYLQKHCIEPIKRLTGEHDFPYLAVSSASMVHYRNLPV